MRTAIRNRVRGVLVLAILAASAIAQSPPPPVAGAAGLELMLRRLGTTGVVMITNAHPDDEPNALIAMLVHGLGVRVVECTATRGEGGQNDVGPEQGLPLSVLRTEELLSVHRIDGAEQLFARAVDFGYSFSVDETFKKWGHDEILADYVRLIRTIRPDVIISMSPDGNGGGQHHQASARITREAFDRAAEASSFPEQIAAGLRPWRASRLYVPLGGPQPTDGAASRGAESRAAESRKAESAPASRPGDVTVDTDVFDAVLGCTYAEIGTRARSMHKSQGMARLLALPGPAVSRYRLAAGVARESSESASRPTSGVDALADGIGLDTAGGRLVRSGGSIADDLQHLKESNEIQTAVLEARVVLSHAGPGGAIAPLVYGLNSVRSFRASLKTGDPEAVFDLDHRLEQKEAQFLQAIRIAAGLRFEALSDAGIVTPGQEIKVSVYVANRLARDLQFQSVTFAGFDPAEGGCATRPSGPLPAPGLVTCESKLKVPMDARVTLPHWKPIPGTSRDELESDVPFGSPFRPTQFRAQAHMTCNGEPLEFEVPVEFRDGSDIVAGEKRSELMVVPSKDLKAAGLQRVEYPHIHPRMVRAPVVVLPAVDAKVAPGVVGWIRGVGDRIDRAVRHLGAVVEPLDEETLRAGDLGRFPVILVGIHALEGRADAVAAKRLLTYVENGGTVVILYQRSGLDETTAAPFPAKTGGNRITAEDAPAKLLVPDHPVFNAPNKLTAEDWDGWVSERGRSFLETKDPRYVDLIEMEDPFEFNKGPKRGILVEAVVGKGRWVYVGLALSRQLEEGVPGAFRLLANLLSLRGGGGS